jgi:hypothetical protein
MANYGTISPGPIAGFEQVTSLSSAKGFQTLPASATKVEVQVEGGQARVRLDGIDPTTSVGVLLEDRDWFTIGDNDGKNNPDLALIRFIQVSGTVKLNVHYYY